MPRVTIANQQSAVPVNADLVRQVVEAALDHGAVSDAEISVAIVDDDAIHRLNRRHLQHDYPTDVLSFTLSEPSEALEAEIIVSGDTALREAARFGWSAEQELLLYVVHGVLHACGHDDHSPRKQAAMREAERAVLQNFGWTPQYEGRRTPQRGRRRSAPPHLE